MFRSMGGALVLMAGSVLSISVLAQDSDVEHKPVSIQGVLEMGQLVKGEYQGGIYNHLWISRLGGWLTKEEIIGERLRLRLSAGAFLWSPAPTVNFWQNKESFWSLSLNEMQATYGFGNLEKPFLEATVGYFPFKYNPDSKNLGEYMYRTLAYPPVILNPSWFIVNQAKANLLGLHLTQTIGPFKHDLLLTSETEYHPLWDFSLGWLGDVNLFNVVDFGCGINLWRFLSVNESATTPKDDPNMYTEPIVQGNDTVGYDTSYYTYGAIKAIARFSFDPKPLIPIGIFGKEDLKVYAEAAILGWKNYGTLYDTLLQRIPVMIGFNIPAFRILDVLSFEWEWFNSPYPNDTYVSIRQLIPKPEITQGSPILDDIKWSITAKRQVVRGLSLSMQVARDHLRLVDWNQGDFRLSYRENILTQDEWYWMMQATFGI